MSYTLLEISKHVEGELLGDPDYVVSSLGSLHKAKPEQLSFISNPKYANQLSSSEAGAVLIRDLKDASKVRNAILVRNPYLAFAKVSQLFVSDPQGWSANIHPSAQIHPTATMGHGVVLGPNVVIGANTAISDNVMIGAGTVLDEDIVIGEKTRIAANVSLYSGVVLGARCIVHSGAVIGSDGFGFAPDQGAWRKIHQLGSVIIGDDVEVGANTTIDRGAIDNTIIGNGVKIDNLVQIAHNVVIGDNSAIAGCVGIAGSSIIGKSCTLGGGVGLAGHLSITDNVHVTAMSLVTRSIHEAGSYSSGTALDSTPKWRRSAARLRRIENMAAQITKLEKQVSTLLTKG